MPNHIQNRLTITGDESEVKKVFDHIRGKYEEDGTEMQIDFNKIILMPKEMEIDSDGFVSPLDEFSFNPSYDKGIREHLNEIKKFVEANPERKEKTLTNFFQGVNNYINYGFATWYKWSIKNWGTKWNAYSQNDKRNTNDTIYFQTAWSSPVELIKILSKQFPNVKMQLDYADEDSGSNTGKIAIKAGEVLSSVLPLSQSVEGYEIFFELHPDNKSNYELVDGKYKYVETN